MLLNLFLLIAAINVIGIAFANPRQKRADPEPEPAQLEAGKRIHLRPHHRLGKREAEEGDVASFMLKINPFIPRNAMFLRNYTELGCVDKKQWCIEGPQVTPSVCPPVDTPTPVIPTCGPTRPRKYEFGHTICNFKNVYLPPPRDLCEECSTPPTKGTTEFKACFSVPPPTKIQRLKYCNPTYMTCHVQPCTYRTAETAPPESPPTPPPCDASQSPLEGGSGSDRNRREVQDGRQRPRYYILVKRSPGTWRRRRSNSPGRRYRIVSQFK